MQICVEVDSNLVKYAGHHEYELTSNNMRVKNSNGIVLFIVCDMKIGTAKIVDVESIPEDFKGEKYKYTAENGWELNKAYE